MDGLTAVGELHPSAIGLLSLAGLGEEVEG